MKTLAFILAFAIAVPAAMVSCDRTVTSETKVKSGDGKTTVEKKTVTENPSGGVTETKEKKEVNNNP